MCGKFTQLYEWRDLVAIMAPLTAPEPVRAEAPVTPMRFAQVLRVKDGAPEFALMRWGFAGKGDAAPDRPRHMHARAETVDALPTFAEAFAKRRCVLIVDTFNEGEDVGARTVQWTVTPKDAKPIAIAALYEEWERGEERLLTFVMITTPPNPLIAQVTDRMPAILHAGQIEAWLYGEPQAAKALLQTFDDEGGWDMARQGKAGAKQRQGDLFG